MLPEIEQCPKCRSCDHVRRKLVTFPFLINAPLDSPHFVVSAVTSSDHHYRHASFVEGLFCDSCQTAFVPQAILADLGLDEREILACRSDWSVSFSSYGP